MRLLWHLFIDDFVDLLWTVFHYLLWLLLRHWQRAQNLLLGHDRWLLFSPLEDLGGFLLSVGVVSHLVIAVVAVERTVRRVLS